MRSDEYAPIEVHDAASTSNGGQAERHRLRRPLQVLVIGVIAIAAYFLFTTDGDGVNVETASDTEAVDVDDRLADAVEPSGRDTLVVQTGDGSSAGVIALDDSGAGDSGDSPDTSTTAIDSSTTLGSGESITVDDSDSSKDSSTSTASNNTASNSTASTRTSSTAGSGNDGGGGGAATTNTTRQTDTTRRTTTTAEPTTTTRRITTTTESSNVSGNVVWVDSRAGSGGDGSQGRPFRTINEGILAVRAGETLMVKGGEYREHVNPGYRLPRGTSSSPITMTNAPGERVVIKGRVIMTDMDYWTFKGINVTWDSDRNDRSVQHLIILNGGTNWVWRDSEIWGAKAYSAMLITKNPRNFTVRNNYIHDTYETNDTNQDHLIYCSCGTGGGVIERNLLVGSGNGRAVKLGGSSSSGGPIGNVTVRYNTMVDNYGPSNIQLNFNTSNITIERNLMVGTLDYAENISTWSLTGSGSRASNNLGFKSPGVLEDHGGIRDGGGNIYRDPRLDSNYVPQDSTAKAYGHKAP